VGPVDDRGPGRCLAQAGGQAIAKGDEVLDVETDKISSSVEAPFSGVLRRQIARQDETLAVGALLGIVVDGEASEVEIDAVIEQFQATFVPGAVPRKTWGRSRKRSSWTGG
jgi:pyruvate dehydrogenase E2 component (dihydrolipoamide acetyltransferase)